MGSGPRGGVSRWAPTPPGAEPGSRAGPYLGVGRAGPPRRPSWARRARGPVGTGTLGTASFVAAVGTVAAALRVGAGPEAAWRRVGVRTDDGVPRRADLARLGGAGVRHVAAVRAAARLSLQVGTPAADLLEQATLAVARDAEAESRRRAALAGPRATARLLAWLPLVGLALGVAVGARPWEQLLGGGAGTLSGLVGVALLAAGRRWTAREIGVAERAGAGHPPAGAPRSGPQRRPPMARGGRRVAALGGPRADGVPPAGLGDPCSPVSPSPAVGGRPRGAGAARAGDRGGRVARLASRSTAPSSRAALPATRRPAVAGDEVEEAVLLDLVEGACRAGAGVPKALDAVGVAVGGPVGSDLRRAARTLGLGAPWEAAWSGAGAGVTSVARSLRPAWEDGVPPGSLLRGAAEAARRDRDARAAEAAARLGVRLVVPLGLCHLPAFVLVGLVPVLGSMATTTLGA